MHRCQSYPTPTTAHYDRSLLNTGNLLNKLYPFELILRDEETNRQFYFELLSKFTLPEPSSRGSIDYELVGVETVESKPDEMKLIRFKSENGKEASIPVRKVGY